MKAFKAAQRNPVLAADALMAFRRLDDDDEEQAEVGALLLAEFLQLVRSLAEKNKG